MPLANGHCRVARPGIEIRNQPHIEIRHQPHIEIRHQPLTAHNVVVLKSDDSDDVQLPPHTDTDGGPGDAYSPFGIDQTIYDEVLRCCRRFDPPPPMLCIRPSADLSNLRRQSFFKVKSFFFFLSFKVKVFLHRSGNSSKGTTASLAWAATLPSGSNGRLRHERRCRSSSLRYRQKIEQGRHVSSIVAVRPVRTLRFAGC
eukprot:SAG31_NODE_2257_length_6072_cov_3.006864_4_plen_200_part_00